MAQSGSSPPQNLPPALQFPSSVVPTIEGFLSDIRVGDVIQAKTLERGTLLLEDQPGVKVTPIIQPGQAAGTGDLMVRYQRTQPFQGEVGLDNHGSRFTGDMRAKADLTWNSPFSFGDQVRVSVMRTSQHLNLGSLAYSGLINGSGWRWRTALSYTDYRLGKDYASLLRSGVAQTRSLGVSYPLLRSQAANLTVTTTLLGKRFADSDGLNQTRENKSAQSLPVSVQFDFRDPILGGGINYGYATLTRGVIHLHGTALDNDQSGARTDGLFTKREIDVSRLQALPGAMSLYLRGYQQAVHKKNLDASEGVSFGGPTGVRAYPVGEASGDKGWLVQMELRYTTPDYSAYAFVDHARVKVNAVVYDNSANLREIAGAGVGARVSRKLAGGQMLSADLSMAWSTGGGAAQSDSAARTPRIWVSSQLRF